MKKHTQEYYNWTDVQTEICKRLNIEEGFFRNYHKVIGGSYKDIWHVWLTYIDHRLYNGEVTSVDVISPEGDIPESLLKEYGEWIIPIVKIFEEVIIEYSDDGYSINIYYYW